MENKTIVVERLFSASIDEVWSAITNKDEMKNWYFDLEEFRPEVGFKFQFVGGPDEGIQYTHFCEITEVIPLKKLSYSWRYDGYSGVSFVTFELFKQEDKTLLKLTHQGIDSFPNENADFALHNFETGWNEIINNSLKNYLAHKSYQCIISLHATADKIYESILNIPLWWTEMFEGSLKQEGEIFTVRFGPSIYKTMVVETLIPNKKIVWKVVDALIDIPELKNKTEWINTKIIWDISILEKETTLKLTHLGLTQKIECYTICEDGWNTFTKSLVDFITTGAGTPFQEHKKG